jgi:membrane fusion protein (multidrug efflux system)
MLLSVELIHGRRRSLAVPEEALVPIRDRKHVYVVGEDGRAQRVEIQIGRRRPGSVEVLSGLERGDQVIAEGTHRVRPGSVVRAVKAEPDAEGEGDASL